MIRITRKGIYKLIETKNHIKILFLDNDIYAWPSTKMYGEMLVTSHRLHKTDSVLSTGRYFIYSVKHEPNFSDHVHLELEVGPHRWQGYLLLTGLPDDHKSRCRIIPTLETISGNRSISHRKEVRTSLAMN